MEKVNVRGLFPSKRMKLAREFDEWAKANGVDAKSPFNVITYLQIEGLLNEEKALEFLGEK